MNKVQLTLIKMFILKEITEPQFRMLYSATNIREGEYVNIKQRIYKKRKELVAQ